ncbi:MAG TPA: hypothetical protein VFX49_11315 [Chloroflexota bacterium]|nr:hypothetical protein [Chloroflexota bacterium]
MEQFAYQTFDSLAPRMELVEQAIDFDPHIARRYHVPGSPTFVLVDPAGKQLTRFHFEPTRAALEARLRPFLF